MLVGLLTSGSPIFVIIIEAVALLISATFSIVLHENAHGYVALKCGDATAKERGRLTFNPVAHFDWIGLCMMLLVGFGWAKPVPINPNRFKNKKKGIVLVSLAGVISNILLAGISLLLLYFLYPYILALCSLTSAVCLLGFLFRDILEYAVILNIMLAFFNILPICPLDGFRLIDGLLPPANKFSTFMYKYGNICLIAFLGICYILDLVHLEQFSVFYQVQQLAIKLIQLVIGV